MYSIPKITRYFKYLLDQAILFRGAGFEKVWPQFTAPAVIGLLLFTMLARFRKAVGETA